MAYEQILREQRDDVVVLTLNRPEKLNAWTARMTDELTDAIQAADADDSVGAVVVTGAGRARSYGENSTSAVRSIKRLLTVNANETDTSAAQKRELAALLEAYASPEHHAAVAAFLSK